MDLVSLLSAAGIGGIVGSLLTTLTQAWIARLAALDNRRFQEKKEAYTGFLGAFFDSTICQTTEAALKAGLWIDRCELVASPSVIVLLQRIKETQPVDGRGHPDRPEIFEALKAAMRADLGVQR